MRCKRVTYLAGAVVLAGLIAAGCAPWRDDPPPSDGDDDSPKGIPKSEMKNPWARAKVGDYIIVRTAGEGRHIKLEVVKANDIEVLVDVGQGPEDDRYEAYNLQEEEQKHQRPEQIPGFVSKTERMENVGGKTIKIFEYTLQGEGNTIVNTYSNEVPLDGLVRAVRNDKVTFEIIDFLKN